MKAISLQSGSSGNCIFVDAGGKRLLFDAGICGAQVEKRLARFGYDVRDVDAVIISHDHADHVRYAGVYQRKYGLPVFLTPQTLKASVRNNPLGRMERISLFFSGATLAFDGVSVQTIPTLHDGADGVAFVVSAMDRRLGIFTDLGHVFPELENVICTLDAVFLESNYDPQMLRQGPYPEFLKKRISGPRGHISNIEAAELLKKAAGNLRWACLAHLSRNNNNPGLALSTHRRLIGPKLKICAASRYEPVGILSV